MSTAVAGSRPILLIVSRFLLLLQYTVHKTHGLIPLHRLWASRFFNFGIGRKGPSGFVAFFFLYYPPLPENSRYIVCRSARLCVCGTYSELFYCLLFVFIRSPNSCRLKSRVGVAHWSLTFSPLNRYR